MDPATASNATSCRSDFGNGTAGRVVNIERCLADPTCMFYQSALVGIRYRAIAQAMAVDSRDGTQQSICQLVGGHFKTDKQHWQLALQSDVFTDVQRQRGFSHTRACSQDNQFGIVEAAGQFVEVGEVRIDTTLSLVALHARVETVHRLVHDITNWSDRGRTAIIENGEDLLFGLVQ